MTPACIDGFAACYRGDDDMVQQVPVDDDAVPQAVADGPADEIAADIAYRRLVMVNIVLVGDPRATPGGWVLIDAGLRGTSAAIMRAAHARFAAASRPAAILLTHGHFDHVGALASLARDWNVPIYAHPLEHPFLNGTRAYPRPDSTAGGGVMSLLAPLYPRGPIDVSQWLQALPPDGTVPELPGWQWIHTPGHAPGHVSFWREADRSMIAGDAFITTAQESAYAVVTQAPELHGPPMYYTPDWDAAADSVRRLAGLEPELVITGHGRPMAGAGMRKALRRLADRFEDVAVPHRLPR
jgi:glyoxylase-like metal-dependent hydrolase (beta-lactamase superfamily II)